MNVEEILNLPMKENSSGEKTIRGYFYSLLREVWRKEEGFNGKRPFGTSSWKFEVYEALIKNNCISGELDEDGYVENVNLEEADECILRCIHFLFFGKEK